MVAVPSPVLPVVACSWACQNSDSAAEDAAVAAPIVTRRGCSAAN